VTLSKLVKLPVGTVTTTSVYGCLAFDENDICVWTRQKTAGDVAGNTVDVVLPVNAVKMLCVFEDSLNSSGIDYVLTLTAYNIRNKVAENTLEIEKSNNKLGNVNLLDLFEIGNINASSSGITYAPANNRVRTKEGVRFHFMPGDTIGLNDYTNARYYVSALLPNGSYWNTGWKTTDLTFETECDCTVLIANLTDTFQTDKNDLASLFFGYDGVVFDAISSNASEITNINILHPVLTSGYLDVNGDIASASETNKEVTTDFIPVDVDDYVDCHFSFPETQSMWLARCLYDAKKKKISTRSVLVNNVNYRNGNVRINFTDSEARYIRISYRTYGTISMTLVSNDETKVNGMRIDDVNTRFLLDTARLNENVKSINHRGYSTFPENTLPAFVESRRNGFVIVETDVRFTSDGVPVLLHDESINRTARNADGTELPNTVNIADITYTQSQDYDFGIYKGSQFAGIKIPKFEDFLKLCRSLGLGCYIELKAGTQAQIENLIDMVEQNGMKKVSTWISASDSMLSVVKNKDVMARLGFISQAFTANTINIIRSLETDGNEVVADLYIYASDIASQISLAKQNSIPVEVWTPVNSTTILEADPYVTGMTTDKLIAGYVLFENAMKN
jgi:glycerophosphoryl diester phosphodiesterase